MKVDKIIKNAKVFTSAARDFHACAFAVKDGKFVYVGDESGLNVFEGESDRREIMGCDKQNRR